MTDVNDQIALRDKRITVMGLGTFGGGLGASRFLLDRGAHVTVTDLRSADQLQGSLQKLGRHERLRLTLGRHEEQDFQAADLVVVNPAVPEDNPLVACARQANVPLTSEMNLFWQHNRGKVIGVTGSNGKSTTTALIHSILKAAGHRCWLGGNLGGSLLPAVDNIQPDDWVVLELSSFQLVGLNRIQASPDVAVVTNFTPNHLDWHSTLDFYREAKQTILRWQPSNGVAVLNGDDADVSMWPTNGRELFFGSDSANRQGVFDAGGGNADVCFAESSVRVPLAEWLTLPGKHNFQNGLAAIAAVTSIGVGVDAVQRGIERFEPLPHRLQKVGEYQGRVFYNDSISTTPESTVAALRAFDRPIVLLAGGYDKGIDFQEMAVEISNKATAVALMGQTASELDNLIDLHSATTADKCLKSRFIAPSFAEAFRWALENSSPGDIILLSPGCASYGWFRSFVDRGEQFASLVRQLDGSPIAESAKPQSGVL